MDISKLTLKKTFDVEIYMPDGSPTDIKISVLSKHSDEFKKSAQIMLNNAPKGRNADKVDLAKSEAQSVALLASVTESWEGLEENGKPLECTPQNVKRIYSDYPFIRSQVDEAIGDDANFMNE